MCLVCVLNQYCDVTTVSVVPCPFLLIMVVCDCIISWRSMAVIFGSTLGGLSGWTPALYINLFILCEFTVYLLTHIKLIIQYMCYPIIINWMCRNTSTMLMPLNLFPLYLSIFTPYYITLKYLSSVFPKPQSPNIVQCVSINKIAYSLWWTIFQLH